MTRIYGVLESGILLMIGIGILWFSLSDHYELLMNAKFRPLTLTGAVLVLVLGVATVAGRRKGVGANMFVCLLYTSPSPRDLSTPRMPSSA